MVDRGCARILFRYCRHCKVGSNKHIRFCPCATHSGKDGKALPHPGRFTSACFFLINRCAQTWLNIQIRYCVPRCQKLFKTYVHLSSDLILEEFASEGLNLAGQSC
jgi:hypothetical protein